MDLISLIFRQPFLLLYAVVVVVSLIKYKKYFDTPLRFLPILLMYTFLTEFMGILTLSDPDWSILIREYYYNNNWVIYNIYAIVFFIYFGYVYHRYLQDRRIKSLILAGLSLYLVVVIANAFVENFTTQTQLYSYTTGGLLLIFAAICYILQEFRKPETRGLRRRNLLVWISLGIAVFYAGYLPIKFIRSSIASIQAVQSGWIRTLHFGLIYFMYGCFLVGFLMMLRMKKPRVSTESD